MDANSRARHNLNVKLFNVLIVPDNDAVHIQPKQLRTDADMRITISDPLAIARKAERREKKAGE